MLYFGVIKMEIKALGCSSGADWMSLSITTWYVYIKNQNVDTAWLSKPEKQPFLAQTLYLCFVIVHLVEGSLLKWRGRYISLLVDRIQTRLKGGIDVYVNALSADWVIWIFYGFPGNDKSDKLFFSTGFVITKIIDFFFISLQ